jgi:hypothetical protein
LKQNSRQNRKFGSRQIEKQFEINSNFKDLAEKILQKVKAGQPVRATQLLEQLIQEIEQHGEDLVIADTSPFGWLAVAKVRAATDLPKSLRKKLEQVDKDLAEQRSRKNGQNRRKFSTISGAGQEPVVRRGDRRLTPEEALFQAGRQVRQGTCPGSEGPVQGVFSDLRILFLFTVTLEPLVRSTLFLCLMADLVLGFLLSHFFVLPRLTCLYYSRFKGL